MHDDVKRWGARLLADKMFQSANRHSDVCDEHFHLETDFSVDYDRHAQIAREAHENYVWLERTYIRKNEGDPVQREAF